MYMQTHIRGYRYTVGTCMKHKQLNFAYDNAMYLYNEIRRPDMSDMSIAGSAVFGMLGRRTSASEQKSQCAEK